MAGDAACRDKRRVFALLFFGIGIRSGSLGDRCDYSCV